MTNEEKKTTTLEDTVEQAEKLEAEANAEEDMSTRVSDIVTDNLTAFGLTAEDTAHFSDVLAAAATKSNTDVSIMGETFKQWHSIGERTDGSRP